MFVCRMFAPNASSQWDSDSDDDTEMLGKMMREWNVPSRELPYPAWGKETSSSKVPFKGDRLVPGSVSTWKKLSHLFFAPKVKRRTWEFLLWNRRFPLETIILRFHVKLGGVYRGQCGLIFCMIFWRMIGMVGREYYNAVFEEYCIPWLWPLPRVTTRIIIFLVGNPYKPLFATVTGKGPHPMYSKMDAFRISATHFIRPFLLE